MSESLTDQIVSFVQRVVGAMGVALTASVEETADGTRINLQGEDGGILVRRGGEGLQALQHLVATAFRRQLGDDTRVVVDCNGFRRDKDAELKQMAAFMAEKVRMTGAAQELGPLNPYERRLAHIALSENKAIRTFSTGDGSMRTLTVEPAGASADEA